MHLQRIIRSLAFCAALLLAPPTARAGYFTFYICHADGRVLAQGVRVTVTSTADNKTLHDDVINHGSIIRVIPATGLPDYSLKIECNYFGDKTTLVGLLGNSATPQIVNVGIATTLAV